MLLLQNIHLTNKYMKRIGFYTYGCHWQGRQSNLPVFLYCDNITLPKCPRPNTLSKRNASIVKPVDNGNCDDAWRRDSYALSLYWSPRTTCGRDLFAPEAAACNTSLMSGCCCCCCWNGWYGILNCGVVGCCTIGDCGTYWALFTTFKLSNGCMICVGECVRAVIEINNNLVIFPFIIDNCIFHTKITNKKETICFSKIYRTKGLH